MLNSLLFPFLSYLIPHAIDFIPSKVPDIVLPFHFPSHQPLQVIISHMNYFNGLLTDLSACFQLLHTLSNTTKSCQNLPTSICLKPRVPSYCFKSRRPWPNVLDSLVERYYISSPNKPVFLL